MLRLPKDGGTYWTTHKGLRIQISYTGYEYHVEATARFYYWEEESIEGWGQNPQFERAVASAIGSLMSEIKKQRIDIWTTTRPSTKQKVKIVMFRPDEIN